jgi:predicted RNase H-like HicB family nuclease
MKIKNYTVVLKKEPEGGYTACVPSLPGCVTYGKNIEEAEDLVKDAIEVYVASLIKHGDEIPEEGSVFLTSVSVPSSNFSLTHA